MKNFFYNNAIPAAVISIEGMPSVSTHRPRRLQRVDLKREYGGPTTPERSW
jgi:hypothetical protein